MLTFKGEYSHRAVISYYIMHKQQNDIQRSCHKIDLICLFSFIRFYLVQ